MAVPPGAGGPEKLKAVLIPLLALRSLDVMVGTWELMGRESGLVGEIHGRLTFEWLEGGFYLVQLGVARWWIRGDDDQGLMVSVS